MSSHAQLLRVKHRIGKSWNWPEWSFVRQLYSEGREEMSREEQFEFGTQMSFGHVETEIPVSLPRRDVQKELCLWNWSSEEEPG